MEEDGEAGAASVSVDESFPRSKSIEMLRQDSAEVLEQNGTLEERMSNSAARYGFFCVFLRCGRRDSLTSTDLAACFEHALSVV